MDESVMKMLLEQNVKTAQSFVQILFNSATKDTDNVKLENAELKRSLEFTQAENDTLKQTVTQLQSSIKRIENLNISQGVGERLRRIEDDKRSKNLRVTGVTEDTSENREQTELKVKKIIQEKLKLDDIQLSEAYRVGKTDHQNASKPRPIIARVASRQQKIDCLKVSKNLRGTSVYIAEDVSKATQDIRNSKMDLLKQKREEGMIAYFSGANLICKPRPKRVNHNRRSEGDNQTDEETQREDERLEDQGPRQHGTQGIASPQEEHEVQQRPQSPAASDVGNGSQPSGPVVGANQRPKRSTAGKNTK